MKVALLALGCCLAVSANAAEKRCPTEVINFTKETGCANDGYVEFCVPQKNRRLRAAVRRIAPDVENKGLQHCGPGELLFFLPVDVENGSCVERGGAMTDKGWSRLCALARLPGIGGFRLTRFE